MSLTPRSSSDGLTPPLSASTVPRPELVRAQIAGLGFGHEVCWVGPGDRNTCVSDVVRDGPGRAGCPSCQGLSRRAQRDRDRGFGPAELQIDTARGRDLPGGPGRVRGKRPLWAERRWAWRCGHVCFMSSQWFACGLRHRLAAGRPAAPRQGALHNAPGSLRLPGQPCLSVVTDVGPALLHNSIERRAGRHQMTIGQLRTRGQRS
jgi:hypothetical protein